MGGALRLRGPCVRAGMRDKHKESAMTQALNALAHQDAAGRPKEPVRAELISFAIGEEQYGVDIMAVREIKGWSEITRLPGQPDYVRGVLNLRGVMVPIIDLRCRFGGGLTAATPLHVVIIVQIEDRQTGSSWPTAYSTSWRSRSRRSSRFRPSRAMATPNSCPGFSRSMAA